MAIKSKDIRKLYAEIERMHDVCASRKTPLGCSDCPYVEITCCGLDCPPGTLDIDGLYNLFEQLEEKFEKRKE